MPCISPRSLQLGLFFASLKSEYCSTVVIGLSLYFSVFIKKFFIVLQVSTDNTSTISELESQGSVSV